jgi:hypothetical protein
MNGTLRNVRPVFAISELFPYGFFLRRISKAGRDLRARAKFSGSSQVRKNIGEKVLWEHDCVGVLLLPCTAPILFSVVVSRRLKLYCVRIVKKIIRQSCGLELPLFEYHTNL